MGVKHYSQSHNYLQNRRQALLDTLQHNPLGCRHIIGHAGKDIPGALFVEPVQGHMTYFAMQLPAQIEHHYLLKSAIYSGAKIK